LGKNRQVSSLRGRSKDIRKELGEIPGMRESGVDILPGAENRLIDELKKVNKQLNALGKKTQPISVELDGKKVLKVLTRRGEDEDDAGLGENIDDSPV